jgi:site-specific DNA-methyltransferase (adenine-specific)
MTEPKTGVIYRGDNLGVLRQQVPDECVHLVYLDPPFNTHASYHLDGDSRRVFKDNWKWDDAASEMFDKTISDGTADVQELLLSLRTIVGECGLTAYLTMMTPRLFELHRVLKPTGSLYLHCDPSASHYLKLLLDWVFGQANFRNEIVWGYKGGGRSRKSFARKHDIILYYTKSGSWTFNADDILVERTNQTWFTDEDGKRYWLKFGKRYYLKTDGKTPEDWWADIDPLHGPYRERLGYPTQKPLALLDRIVRASSNPGDIVLDPFCGSGTTLVAAQSLGRRWVGIDASEDAVSIASKRLRDTFPEVKISVQS